MEISEGDWRLSDLKTGDILLFSGRGSISASIKWATQSPWTHIGMVVAVREHEFLCLWEATRETNILDLDSGLARPGVQLVPLDHRLREYDGHIALRHLHGVNFDEVELATLMALRSKLASRPYQDNKLELMSAGYARAASRMGAALRRIAGLPTTPAPVAKRMLTTERSDGIFCSELVAQAYQALGLIRCGRFGRPAHKYTPADFSERGEHLPWLRGQLGPEVWIKRQPQDRRRLQMLPRTSGRHR